MKNLSLSRIDELLDSSQELSRSDIGFILTIIRDNLVGNDLLYSYLDKLTKKI